MPELGFLAPLQNEDCEGDAEMILFLIKERVSAYPRAEYRGRMRWGITKMIKRLEGEDSRHGLKVAHCLWNISHAQYPDLVTKSDKPQSVPKLSFFKQCLSLANLE